MNTIKPKKYGLLIAIIAITIMVVIPVQTSAQAVDAPWPMWRRDPANSGATDLPGPTYLWLKWKFQTDGPVVSSPSIVGGKVYFGSNDGKIYCVDADNGNELWSYATEFLARGSPAVVNGKVYTGPDDGNIYCLDANTGSLIWKTTTVGGLIKTVLQPTAQVHASPCVVDGRVYVGHLDGYMYCLDANTGEILWQYKPLGGDRIASSPAVVDGMVYYGSCDGNIYKLQASNGKLVWKFNAVINPPEGILKLPGLTEVDSSPMVKNGIVYVFANCGYWFALNASDASVLWQEFIIRYRGSYSVTQSLPIGSMAYANGKTYQAFGYFASAFDAKTGEMLWNRSIGYPSYSSATYAAGIVYMGSDLPAVYSFDAMNGTRYSSFVMPSNIHSSPAVAYGNLYIGCFDWNLYCITERPPKTNTLIVASLSVQQMEVGNPVNVTGAITPDPGAVQVTVTFTLPNGNTETSSTTSSNGTYVVTYTPGGHGIYSTSVSWSGNDLYAGGSTDEMSFTVLARPPPTPPGNISTVFAASIMLGVIVALGVFFFARRK